MMPLIYIFAPTPLMTNQFQALGHLFDFLVTNQFWALGHLILTFLLPTLTYTIFALKFLRVSLPLKLECVP